MSYAPASPDRSSFYGGATSTQTTSTTATQIGRTRPLATSAPSGFSLPVSPTPTIHHQPYTHHYSHQQYQLELSPQHHQRREYIAAQFPPNPSLSHLDAHHQPAYSPKSPVSPPPYSTHHAPHPQQALTHFNPHSPQSPQPPRAPQQSAPLNFNAAHVASPVQIQFHSSYGTPGQPQGQLYQLESPQTHPTIYAAPQQNFAQQLGGPIPTGHSQRLEPPPHIKSENDYHHHAQVAPREQISMPPRRSTAAAVQPPPIDPSPVKTKFPTARIKRIMQADEEVGKVAQQTPIAVGKALEMFMIALVSKSHDIAKDKGAKRVTAQHLKQVVESDDQWDFLREIVGRVSETEDKSKAGRAKAESSSDEEQQVEVKKKGRGGRKKKTA